MLSGTWELPYEETPSLPPHMCFFSPNFNRVQMHPFSQPPYIPSLFLSFLFLKEKKNQQGKKMQTLKTTDVNSHGQGHTHIPHFP